MPKYKHRRGFAELDHVPPNTEEEIERVPRVVAGAEACRGPEDAAFLLEAIGILPTKYNKKENSA